MKKKTSVLLVDNSGKENTIIQIPTQILLNWKRYFLILNSIILILLSIIGVFIYQKTSEMYKEKLARANKIKSLIDIKKAKQSFQSIDESIFQINKFLDERGLQEFRLKNSGGVQEDFEITDINEIAEYYDKKIQNIEQTLTITPVGLPSHGEISSTFGYRNNPFGGYSTERHSGLDFRGNIGDPVKTTAKGKVAFAGVKGGYGNCIIIEHSNQLSTLYGHLSKINVTINQEVIPGEIIGEVGNTGRSTGPHLHYEVLKNDERIDPKLFLKLK